MAETISGFRKHESPTAAGGMPTPDDEPDRSKEDAMAQRMVYRGETLSSELIASAETPQELFTGLRRMEKMLEDGTIPQGLSERYTPPRELAVMYERKENLKITIDELNASGVIKNYNSATGEADVKKKYATLALSVEEEETPILDEKGRKRGIEVKYHFKFGTPEKRAELAKAYEKAILELETRDIMGEHLGVRLNIEFRDSLETLTAIMHGGRMPKFKVDHLEALFNMPGVKELASNPENKQLGDQIEEAVFCNLVMLNSGNKQRMLDFLERPGVKHLIAKMSKEKGQTYEKWKLENIGDVDSWVEDYDSTVDTGKNKGGKDIDPDFYKKTRDLEKTWRYEKDKGLRGTLTEWSNIAAWAGNPSEFGADKEKKFIEKTIGGLVGSIEASWIAAATMRMTGTYASEGYVALPNGKSHLPLGEGRFISGDDTGKFWAYMFNYKEGTKGRASGLKDMIGKIPDMAMNLFDWAQVEMKDLPKNPDGTYQKRSVWDAWLGTPGGKAKTDLLTGESTTELTSEEPYHRLGDTNFASLEREFHATFTIMQWLMGNERGPTGLLIEALKTDFRFDEDFTLNNLKKLRKYIGIVMNPIILTKGSLHRYSDVFTATPQIGLNYFKNLMSARINSVSFAMGILNSSIKLYNPTITSKEVYVPAAVLAETFINEAAMSNPKDETELVGHYIDTNLQLRSVPSGSADVDKVVANATFESRVGRVTGRAKT